MAADNVSGAANLEKSAPDNAGKMTILFLVNK
jgi:hypothetical protein